MLNAYERKIKMAGFSPEVEQELRKKIGENDFDQFKTIVAREIAKAPWNLTETMYQEFMNRMGKDIVDTVVADPQRWLLNGIAA